MAWLMAGQHERREAGQKAKHRQTGSPAAETGSMMTVAAGRLGAEGVREPAEAVEATEACPDSVAWAVVPQDAAGLDAPIGWAGSMVAPTVRAMPRAS